MAAVETVSVFGSYSFSYFTIYFKIYMKISTFVIYDTYFGKINSSCVFSDMILKIFNKPVFIDFYGVFLLYDYSVFIILDPYAILATSKATSVFPIFGNKQVKW